MWCVCVCFSFFFFGWCEFLKIHGVTPCIICVIILIINMCSIISPSDYLNYVWLFILPMVCQNVPNLSLQTAYQNVDSGRFDHIATAHTESAMPWDYVQNMRSMVSSPVIFVNPSNIPPWNLPIAWPLQAILGPDQQAFTGGMLKSDCIDLPLKRFLASLCSKEQLRNMTVLA